MIPTSTVPLTSLIGPLLNVGVTSGAILRVLRGLKVPNLPKVVTADYVINGNVLLSVGYLLTEVRAFLAQHGVKSVDEAMVETPTGTLVGIKLPLEGIMLLGRARRWGGASSPSPCAAFLCAGHGNTDDAT